MDNYENEFTPTPKKSPYADSPYECAYIAPEASVKAPKAKKRKGGLRPLFVVILLAVCCAATAMGITHIWQGRMERMEAAMNDKFAALEQIYNENKQPVMSQPLPNEGPKTPSQVYAENVKAVVAVAGRYETKDGYGESSGSGFVISADGYVVTNYHVIEGCTQVVVVTHDNATLQAQVVGYEATNDIALLKVNGENLPFVAVGSSDKLLVGEQVMAIGNPLGELTASLTVGYISAKDRIVDTDGTVINMLQTDAAINAGNSGGPLFNTSGQVIGVITAKYSGNSGSGVSIEGLGFAIPMDDVAGILEDLKEYGYVTGAYLGVYVRDVDSTAQSYGLPAGAYVQDVEPGLAADRAGLRAGDIIVNLGGYDVDSVTTLTRVLRRFEAGDSVSVTVYRNGKQEYLTVRLDEKPVEKTEDAPQTQQPESENGFENWFDFFAPFFGIG